MKVFKVGDKVQVENFGHIIIGEVFEISDSSQPYHVKWSDGDVTWESGDYVDSYPYKPFYKSLQIGRSSHFDMPNATRIVIKKGLGRVKVYEYPTWASLTRIEFFLKGEWAKKYGTMLFGAPYLTPSIIVVEYIFTDDDGIRKAMS